ncbi:Decapping nuclease rai1 [Pseudocercospora fuligena]|uniref:Decapping nuclease n=1 Tax=Pseudocercospora fuligena TaxID=685502 RepID=A0A8H6RP33_9PEZI|nr:Decapping nuclease rai1 [Pseudocercospora fuligena]
MQSFRFQDLRPFSGQGTAIKRPREVTEFSFDDKHKPLPLDDRSLRYYYPPLFNTPGVPQSQNIDLSKGFESFIKYDDTAINLHLNPLLNTIEQYEAKNKTKLDADILTWRGMMTKILSAPFDKFGEFEMNATYFDGTIYIEENQAAKAAENNNLGRSYRQHGNTFSPEQMQYWGYKFETLATLPRPWAECSRDEIENREDEIVNNNAQYCSIVRTGIGGHTILIGGEVDAVEGCKPDDPNEPIPYVELKTSENFRSGDVKSAQKFERKLCRMWAQSFLLGVPKIIIGFRSATGHLERLEEWKTLQIPNFVKRQGMQSWDGNICINFTAAFLDFLKQQITGEGTWTISRRKGAAEILLHKISEEYAPDIVPAQFRAHRGKLKAEKNESEATGAG